MARFWIQLFCKEDYMFGESMFKGTADEAITHVKTELKREDLKEYVVNAANVWMMDGRGKRAQLHAAFRLKRGRVVKSEEIKEQYPPIEEPESYRIPDYNMPWLEEAFKKLERKAAKLGVGKVGFEIVGTEHKVQKDGTVDVWHIVKPLGEAPKLNGWRLAATLQHEDGCNVVRAVPGMQVPGKYRTAKAYCDHCNTRRGRKDTYVVVHEDGTFKQVGRQCLRDFLGGTSPDELVNFAAWVASIEELIEEAKERVAGGSYHRPIDKVAFLEHVAQVVVDDGYFLGSMAAREQERESTCSKALTHMFPPKGRKPPFIPHTITDEARELVAKAMEWADALRKKEDKSDYEHNLLVTLGKEYIDWRDVGITASVIGAYKRYLRSLEKREKKEREADKYKNSKHFGIIGKRDVFELELIFRTGFNTDYGYLHLYKFVDKKGNVAVWKSGTGLELEVGDKIKLKATVKDHDLYDGVRQTVLTRCAIVE